MQSFLVLSRNSLLDQDKYNKEDYVYCHVDIQKHHAIRMFIKAADEESAKVKDK